MLNSIVSVANFIITTFYYMFYGSYKTGQLLVGFLGTAFHCFLAFVNSCVTFFTVLYESVVIFLQDNLQFLQQFLTFAALSFDAVYSNISTLICKVLALVHGVICLIISMYTTIFSGINLTIVSIGQIIVFLKRLIILFGAGVWFLITLIPLLLYYLCILFVSLVHRCYHEIWDICISGVSNVKTFVKGMILFVFDVPIESFIGIIIALSLAYIFSQFYILITSFVKQKLRLLGRWCRRQQADVVNMYQRAYRQRPNQITPLRARPQIRPVRQTNILPHTPVKLASNNSTVTEEKCCVICQERHKCVLLLPCRHLCLCTECTRELRYYEETCPICRANIDSTMKIYV